MSRSHKETNEFIKNTLIDFLHQNGFIKSYLTKKETILVKGDYITIPNDVSITIEQLKCSLKNADCSINEFLAYLENSRNYKISKLINDFEEYLKGSL